MLLLLLGAWAGAAAHAQPNAPAQQPMAQATPLTERPPATPLGLQALGDGVYAFIGQLDGEVNVGNTGLVVGSQGSLMINSGGSYAQGQAMLEAAERVGGQPVRWLVITQALQEFILGAAAFEERGIPILAQRATAELMARRCQGCLERQRSLRGAAAMAGTRVVVPQRHIDQAQRIDLGQRTVELLPWGAGSSNADLVVHDPRSGTVFAGALASLDRLPDLRDAQLGAWLSALQRLQALASRLTVPGHGPASRPERLQEIESYLRATDAQVHVLLHEQVDLLSATEGAALPAFAHWALHPAQHARNVQQRYLELELQTPPDAPGNRKR